MKLMRFSLIGLVFLLFAGCAVTSRTVQKKPPESPKIGNQKAYDHYLEGALYDFQNQYERALIEYYQALLYDSTSAQIYKAIARDLMRLQEYDSAVGYLKKGAKINPDDPEILNLLGEAYYNLKEFPTAVSYYEKLFLRMPYNETVRNNLIFLYSTLKMNDRLAALYKRLMTLYPGETEYRIQYAMALMKQGKLNEARQVLEATLQQDTSEINAYFLLGSIYEAQKDTAKAIGIYRKIVEKNPDSHQALTRLYRYLREKRDWHGIETIYGHLLEQDSTNNQVRLILGESYFFQKKYPEAKKMLEPVLSDSSMRIAALEMLGRIAFEEKQFDEATNYFTLLTNEAPEDRFGWIFLAVINNQQKRYDASIRILKKGLEVLPDDPDLLNLYGTTLSQVGRDRDAIEPLKKALQADSTDVNTIAALANVYDKLKMWRECDSLYEAAIRRFPNNALLLNNYSYSLSTRGVHLDRALEMARRALKQEPDNGAYLDTMGWIYYKMGHYQQALDYILKAVRNREDSPEVLEHLGDVYFKLGDTAQARKYWEQALQQDPENKSIKEKLRNL